MGEPFWGGSAEDAAAWDACWLGDDFLPGIVEVEVDKSRDVDEKKSKGQDGPRLSDDGYPAARVVITLRIWTAEQWDEWQEVYSRIDPQRPGALREPLTILNAETRYRGIDTVYVTRITGRTPQQGGVKTETIECLQWFPEPKPTKTTQQVPSEDPEVYGPPPPPPTDNVFLTDA